MGKITDTDRLDFIENNLFSLWPQFEKTLEDLSVPGQKAYVIRLQGWRLQDNENLYKSARDAIDYAILAKHRL
jgi:hypothetical protein